MDFAVTIAVRLITQCGLLLVIEQMSLTNDDTLTRLVFLFCCCCVREQFRTVVVRGTVLAVETLVAVKSKVAIVADALVYETANIDVESIIIDLVVSNGAFDIGASVVGWTIWNGRF